MSAASRTALPPGPRLPSPVQAIGWIRRPLPFMQRCQRRYGDTFTLRMLHWGTWVLLSDPDDVKKVFTAKASSLGVDVPNPLLGPVLGRRSVMLLEEPEHMTRRKLMLPPFHGQGIETDGAMMAAVAREEIGRWPIGEPFALWPRMQAITQEVVVRAVFGTEAGPRLDGLRERLHALTEWMSDGRHITQLATLGPRWLVRSRHFRAAIGPVEEAVLDEVRRRRANPQAQNGDIVSMLAQARYEDGSLMSQQDLRDELITLLTDGPTSSSLAWAFERLLRHPDKLERAREEACAGGDAPYLDAVIKETLRLCPPVPVVVRRLREPMRLGGYDLPAGTTVAPCVSLIHHNEEIYPQARSFVPERFLDKPTGTYTWIPFGGGVRRCLAASYAELEMKRVLRTVLSEVELRPVENRSEGMRKGAISFGPDQSGPVVAQPC